MEKIEQKEKIYLIQPVMDEHYRVLEREVVSLIESAGALYAGSFCPKIREINPATYIGTGKLSELKERLEGLDITILFNGELTPSQTLNISAVLDNKKVIDRTTLILAIFAKNAKSSEGKLQVELAQLKYMYPRLKGKGEALSRLGGGIGTRGPGETKLETDRRRIRDRITYLESKLKALETRRSLLRNRRKKSSAFTISLIGYTNTGKSTLLNLLTKADVYAADQLFATLDPTSRLFTIDGIDFILTDTVGFLRELPHNLISAFHSTLESALNCDLLLIVCDANDDYEMQLRTTLETLLELNCEVPYIVVMNKSEKLKTTIEYPPNSVFISAKYGLGIDRLKAEILAFFQNKFKDTILHIPYQKLGAYSKQKRFLIEKSIHYKEEGVEVFARIPTIYINKFMEFIAK